jgi:hypothetical protein
MPVFDLDQYAKELEAAGVAKELIDKLNAEVRPGFMRQDDYSRKQQELQTQRTAVQNDYQRLSAYEQSLKEFEATYGPREQWGQVLAAAFERQNPNPDGSGRPAASTDDIAALKREFQSTLDTVKQQFAQQLEQTGQGAAAFSRFYLQAHKHWEKEYGTELPEDDFRKFYEDNGHTDPRVALQLFERPYADKKRDDEWTKKLDAAREEGRRSAVSQGGIPEVSSNAGGWLGSANFPAVGTGGIVDLAKAASDELPPDQAAQQFAQRMNAVRNGQSPAAAVTAATATK